MADEHHLKMIHEAIARHEIAIWNRMRRENPDAIPDLSGADLRRSDLRRADLHGVIFREANLRAADLGEADLSGADLSRANLMLARLGSANLSGADFSGASLIDANFTAANLSGADFSDAMLGGALLLEADLNEASFEKNVKDLTASQVKGAKNWGKAYFSRSVLENLGLPPDHNETLRKETEERRAKV